MSKGKKAKDVNRYVNRKWLNRTYRRACKASQYFAGTSTREVALSIAKDQKMHPVFVGKIDELLTKLIVEGAYRLSNGLLISCEVKPKVDMAAVRRREMVLRAARLGKQQYRDLVNEQPPCDYTANPVKELAVA